uniref:Uncharacterized protein n=1 Tax=Oryza barthii TaxID=65489 RepID=A0A0D3HD42_9ORYZ
MAEVNATRVTPRGDWQSGGLWCSGAHVPVEVRWHWSNVGLPGEIPVWILFETSTAVVAALSSLLSLETSSRQPLAETSQTSSASSL